MKVLYITTNFPRWAGDAHSPWIVEVIKMLRDRGVAVEVLAPSYEGLSDHSIEGIPVHRFRYCLSRWETLTHNEGAPNKIRNPLYLLLVPPYMLFGLLRTAVLCRPGHYDVIHVHWPLPSGVFGMLGKWLGRTRMVASFHGAELLLVQRFPFLKPVLAFIIKQCDAVSANSQFTAELIRQVADVPVWVIPFGSRIEVREQPVAQPPSGRVLFVGRLIERKGLPFLVEAVRLLADTHSVHLDIVGEGNQKTELMALVERLGVSDRVTFRGRVDDEELVGLYAECDLFVLPAIVDSKGDTEGLGVVLLEAMSYKKPVVATNVGGIPDIVRDQQTGLLVEQKDAQALAEAIKCILEDTALARRLGEQGAAYVKQRFDWTRIVDDVEALYHGQEESTP